MLNFERRMEIKVKVKVKSLSFFTYLFYKSFLKKKKQKLSIKEIVLKLKLVIDHGTTFFLD